MPARLATAYQLSPWAWRASRIRAATPVPETARTAARTARGLFDGILQHVLDVFSGQPVFGNVPNVALWVVFFVSEDTEEPHLSASTPKVL